MFFSAVLLGRAMTVGGFGVSRAHIWFVGDRLDTKVAGARAAGMTPFLYVSRPMADDVDRDVIAVTWPDLVGHFHEARP
jgi:FMN phosphatase YigB (HAD superfamily)